MILLKGASPVLSDAKTCQQQEGRAQSYPPSVASDQGPRIFQRTAKSFWRRALITSPIPSLAQLTRSLQRGHRLRVMALPRHTPRTA
jgi:hypothetical protein